MRRPAHQPLATAGALALLLLAAFAGCTGLTTPHPSADVDVGPDRITVGEAVDLDARDSSTPDGTVITDYIWDFGDGITASTRQGFTSHVYVNAGTYHGTLTVVNDAGGDDEVSFEVYVNAPPVLLVDALQAVKVGQTILLDASSSYDPEGGVLRHAWDLDVGKDSDADGDAGNDVDHEGSTWTGTRNVSGQLRVRITITDDMGASQSQDVSIDIVPRWWQVEWIERQIIFEWEDTTAEGESWELNQTPAQGLLILDVNASLILDQEQPGLWPADNFTLIVRVPRNSWSDSSETQQADPSSAPVAWLERIGLNDQPQNGVHEADSVETLRTRLLDQPGSRFGNHEWLWEVRADQADPDGLLPGLPDPDTGNGWTLKVVYTVLEPVITEVGGPEAGA